MVEENAKAKLNTHGQYYIGDQVRIAGVPKRMQSKKLLDKMGTISVPKMTNWSINLLKEDEFGMGMFHNEEISLQERRKPILEGMEAMEDRLWEK